MRSYHPPAPGRPDRSRRTTSPWDGCSELWSWRGPFDVDRKSGNLLQDHGRHLLDGLRGRIDHRDAVRGEHRIGAAQLVGALLQRGVAGVGPAFLPDLA